MYIGNTFHILGILELNRHMDQGAAHCESRVFKSISTNEISSFAGRGWTPS